MYKNIYFDSRKNQVHLTEIVDGKTKKSVCPMTYDFYVQDNSKKSTIKDIFGTHVELMSTNDKSNIQQLKESGYKVWESDIPEDVKFLQKRYIGQNLKPEISQFNVACIDIEVEAGNVFPDPETAKWPINLISVSFSKTKEIFTFGNRPYDGLNNYYHCPDEKRLLERFISVFRKNKVDILTGWYIQGFDIKYIINRCKFHGIEKFLSPLVPLSKIQMNRKTGIYPIPGISILDYRDLYMNKTFIPENRESYSLQYISMYELNEGKLEYEGEIYDLYKTDWIKYVDYNRQDVNLVTKLDDKLKLIELAINISYSSLIPFERIFSSVQVMTGLILRKLRNKNLVMPDKKIFESDDEFEGAYVEAVPGMHKHVMSFDVTSMYPHMIMMYNISPETLVLNPKNTDGLIKTPVEGTYYLKNQKGILPEIVSEIFEERKMFRKLRDKALENGDKELAQYYYNQQMTRKIMINSMYGVLGNKYFHFYNLKNAEAVTLSGQHLIKYLSTSVNDYFKNYFYKNKTYFKEVKEENKIKKNVVIYIDTDSNYLTLEEIKDKIAPKEDFLTWANKFSDEFFDPFFKKLLDVYASGFGVEQIIIFNKEKIILKQLILSKKKYVCEVIQDEGKVYDPPKFFIRGIESRRSSTPKFCRDKIEVVVKHIFDVFDRDSTSELIKQIKKEFKNAPIDTIASPRGINDYNKYASQVKSVESKLGTKLLFPKSVPIHVRAAMNYNNLTQTLKIKVVPINNGAKIKYIYVNPDNVIGENVIGFVGNYPKDFNTLFKVDYDLQFEKSFSEVIQRMYDELGWGTINFNSHKLKTFFS